MDEQERVDIDMNELLGDGADHTETTGTPAKGGGAGTATPAPEQNTEGGGGAAETTTPAPAAPARVELSPESMAQLAKTIGAAQPASQPQPQPELTPEQARELLAVYEAGEADIAELGLPPTATKKLNMILQAVVKQAVTAAALQTELVRRQFNQAITPLRSMYEEQQLSRLRDEFFAGHEDLKGREKVVELVYTQLSKNPNWKPADKAAAFKDVATEARRVINDLLQGQGGNSGQTSTGASASGARKMPTVTAGGQAGGARGGAKAETDKDKAFNRWLLDMN